MPAVSSPWGSSTTASGLPAKRRSVNTFSVKKRRRMLNFSRVDTRYINLRMTPTLSLPLSGGGKSKPHVRRFGLMPGACRLLHLPLKGGEHAPDLIRGRREAPGGGRKLQ